MPMKKKSLFALSMIALLIFMARYAMREYTSHARKPAQPTLAEKYRILGTARSREGHYQEAIEAYQQALAIRPDYNEAYVELGLTYLKLGRYQEALDRFRHAIGLVLLYSLLLLFLAAITLTLLAYGICGLVWPKKTLDFQSDFYARHKLLGKLVRLDLYYYALEQGGHSAQRVYSAGALVGSIVGFYVLSQVLKLLFW
jgi:tetratricopeptide (TPR) repeat protein